MQAGRFPALAFYAGGAPTTRGDDADDTSTPYRLGWGGKDPMTGEARIPKPAAQQEVWLKMKSDP